MVGRIPELFAYFGGIVRSGDFAVHECVAAEHLPAVGHVAVRAELKAAHGVFTLQHGRWVPWADTRRPGIGLRGVEHSRVHAETAAEQVPLRSGFDASALFRIQQNRTRTEAEALS